jgi:hypothetical protein
MATSFQSLRVEELRSQLRSAEAELNQKKTLTSELCHATGAVNEAERLSRVNAARITETSEELRDARQTRDRTPREFEIRSAAEARVLKLEADIRALTIEGEKLSADLIGKRFALQSVERRIASHPAYQAFLKQQRELVDEGVSVVGSFFTATLDAWPRLSLIVAKIEQREDELIARSIPELRANGLPDVTRILCGFFRQAVPRTILEAIDHEKARASHEISRVREMAARGFVE